MGVNESGQMTSAQKKSPARSLPVNRNDQTELNEPKATRNDPRFRHG